MVTFVLIFNISFRYGHERKALLVYCIFSFGRQMQTVEREYFANFVLSVHLIVVHSIHTFHMLIDNQLEKLEAAKAA